MPQPDHLRCSDADRTAIEQLLTDAYSDGRLTREEHDERLNRTWEAKTFGDLREITTDLARTVPMQRLLQGEGRRLGSALPPPTDRASSGDHHGRSTGDR